MSLFRATPKQERASKTLETIRREALIHLREVGVRQFSTGVVAARSYVAVGTIYRYFEDTEALIEDVAPGACRAWERIEILPQIVMEWLDEQGPYVYVSGGPSLLTVDGDINLDALAEYVRTRMLEEAPDVD